MRCSLLVLRMLIMSIVIPFSRRNELIAERVIAKAKNQNTTVMKVFSAGQRDVLRHYELAHAAAGSRKAQGMESHVHVSVHERYRGRYSLVTISSRQFAIN